MQQDELSRGGSHPAATWLYIQREESVRVEVREVRGWLHFMVSGPYHRRGTYIFADAAALLRYHAEFEGYLLAQGYVVQDFTSDRRRGGDRRRWRRQDDKERRRP